MISLLHLNNWSTDSIVLSRFSVLLCPHIILFSVNFILKRFSLLFSFFFFLFLQSSLMILLGSQRSVIPKLSDPFYFVTQKKRKRESNKRIRGKNSWLNEGSGVTSKSAAVNFSPKKMKCCFLVELVESTCTAVKNPGWVTC